MSSGEFEQILIRNGNFISVRRAGSGDGAAGVYETGGKYILGITAGQMPEYSFMQERKYGCECTPTGLCRTGAHGIRLVRGWRNILFELASRGRIRITNEIVRVLGEESTVDAVSRLLAKAPMHNPEPSWNHSILSSASS